MIDTLLSFIAPHHCSGCNKTGSLLCSNCKYNIISEPYEACLVCEKPTYGKGLCNTCRAPYSRVWVVSTRKDVVQRLIDLYKFERARSAYKDLGELLDAALPELPSNTIVIPVPTITRHIRERGYDHMLLVARYITRKRRLVLSTNLVRATQTTQRGAKADSRQRQAKQAFTFKGLPEPTSPYLLIDDIYTTGSTIRYAAQQLKEAGVKEVWVAIIARQTLD